MKKTLLVLTLVFCLVFVSACTKKNNENTTPFNPLDTNTSGEIDVMLWSGDGLDHEDIGSEDWTRDDIIGANVAAIYAVAKEFKKVYPNVKINLYSKVDDPDGNDTTWATELDNFNLRKGKYPDIWASKNLVEDMKKGIVADLSVFSGDETYKSFNSNIMNMMNYYGFQAGLPQYVLPWGIYVNRALANNNNLDVPEIDWTWDEYTDFVTQAPGNNNFYGSINASMGLVRTALIESQLQNVTAGSKNFLNINTRDFQNAIRSLPDQAELSIYSQSASGNIDSTFLDKGGNYSYKFFCENLVLSSTEDPWMIQFSTIAGNDNTVKSTDWDIYPRPNIAGLGTHVGAVLDPLAIFNYCGQDSDKKCNDVELGKMQLAYTFAKFWIADTASWQARANQQYFLTAGSYGTALTDSFPAVTGAAFDAQMEIWYSTPSHEAYENATKFPGFQEVVRLWKAEKIFGISDKAYPMTYVDEAGNTIDCFEPISRYYDEAYIGIALDDASWYSTYSARLDEFNTILNTNFEKAFEELQDALVEYYAWDRSKF